MTLFSLALLWSAPVARADRPTDPDALFHFEEEDVLATWDHPSGLVRVHYSVDGPHQTRLADADEDGVPDFVGQTGEIALDALDAYDVLGVQAPRSETEFGVGDLGGSPALDVYLVDHGGSADGSWGNDACRGQPAVCAGHLVVENDFEGYGYDSPEAGLRVVVSHELFHGVQASYDADLPVWVAEGTAVWGERYIDPDVDDFLRFADAWFEEPTRSLDRPPTGPVQAFAYSTALWWDFLTEEHGDDLMVDLLPGLAGSGDDAALAMDDVLADFGEDTRDAWERFSVYNLRTGPRAGLAGSHPYADRLVGVSAETDGRSVDDTHRFHPLATGYWRIQHPGGDLWFALDEAAPDLRFSVHQVASGDPDGPVDDSWFFTGDTEGVELLVARDLPAGGYWVVGTMPDPRAGSARRRICLGTAAVAERCVDEEPPAGDEPAAPPSCGCATAERVAPWALWAPLGLLLARRRRQGRSTSTMAGT